MKNQDLFKKILAIVLGASTFALSIFVVVYFVPRYNYTNFKKASIEEMQEIDLFYNIYPKVISIGEVFDVKLIACEFMRGDGGGSATISLLKKIDNDAFFDMEIEYFNEGISVGDISTNKMSYSHQAIFSKYYEVKRYYLWSIISLGGYFDEELFVTEIDEIRITFNHELGREIHILSCNADDSRNVLQETLMFYYESEEKSSNIQHIVRANIVAYMNALVKNDFEEWEAEVVGYMDAYRKDSNSFEGKIFEEFHSSFFGVFQPNKWQTKEEYYRYMDLLKETNAIISSNIEY